jgi:hemerythrin-like domain-containing protein
MPITEAPRLCDTHDMVIVHRAFRREFALLPAMVTAVQEGDTDRSALIAAHAREWLGLLHHHHAGEDELLWPRLRDHRDIDTELVGRMEAQHERMAGIIGQVGGPLDRWAATAGLDQRAELAGLLARLRDGLDEHLADEEAHILPVVEVTLSAAQWEELGQRGIASVPKPRLLVVLGYMLEETTPEEAAAFLAHVPRPGRIGYRLVGRRKFQQESAAQRRDLAAAGRYQ